MRRFDIRLKFIGIITLFLVAIFAAISFVLIRSNTISLRQNLLRETRAFAALATKPIGDSFVLYKDSGRLKLLHQVQKFVELDAAITNIAIVDTSGNVLFTQHESIKPTISQMEAASFEPVYRQSDGALTQIIYPYFEDSGQHKYSIVYDVSNESINTHIESVTKSILRFSVIALAVSAILTILFINRTILTPLRRVSKQAIEISKGRLDQGITSNGNDEISDVAQAVNSMSASLKESITKLQELDKLKSEFMIIASHNLRTPITVIDGYVEALQAAESQEKLQEMLAVIEANNHQLSSIVEELLTVSQLESKGGLSMTLIPEDITPVLNRVANDFKILSRSKDIIFESKLYENPLIVNLNRLNFQSALTQLMDNAIKFTKSGGRVVLSSALEDELAVIKISDTGVGIPSEEMPRLFTKFHRGTDIIHYNYDGLGIGLYASKLIIDQHHGSLDIQSILGEGTTATISLPLISDEVAGQANRTIALT